MSAKPWTVLLAALEPVVDIGPLFLLIAGLGASLACGYTFRRVLIEQLRLPLGERDVRSLLVPYAGLLLSAVAAVGSVPLLFSVPGVVTYPFALLVGSAVATAIWMQFITKVLALPPERFNRLDRRR